MKKNYLPFLLERSIFIKEEVLIILIIYYFKEVDYGGSGKEA